MKIKTKLFFYAFLSLIFSSCDDFLERDLNGQQVVILAPINNTVSSSYTQVFWWEEMKGASSYKLQIVSPNFGSVQSLVVDTNIVGTQFAFTLQPGIYQWRIRGENSIGFSDYVTYNLTIDSSLNLGNQTVLLNSPSDNIYSNSLMQVFSWYNMPNATEYLFGIFNQSGIQIGNYFTTTQTTTTYNFPDEGVYKWRVFAQNSQSISPYSERIITIDTTKPNMPIITYLPLNDTTSLNPVPLTWNIVEIGANYKIYISTDSTFSTYFDTLTSDNYYDFHNSNIGQFYYWKVKTIDRAGNESMFSNFKRFRRY